MLSALKNWLKRFLLQQVADELAAEATDLRGSYVPPLQLTLDAARTTIVVAWPAQAVTAEMVAVAPEERAKKGKR